MLKSESIIHNLLIEIDSLSRRITTIQQAYCNTKHLGLRERLFYENKNISQRISEILSIAKELKIIYFFFKSLSIKSIAEG